MLKGAGGLRLSEELTGGQGLSGNKGLTPLYHAKIPLLDKRWSRNVDICQHPASQSHYEQHFQFNLNQTIQGRHNFYLWRSLSTLSLGILRPR